MTFRFNAEPDGYLALDVRPLDDSQTSFKPTLPQARAFQYLLENQKALRQTVLDAIFSAYGGWRDSYMAQNMPSENMPKLSKSTDLVRVIAPSTIYVLANEKDGLAHIGLGFTCKWDEEHALGVLTYKGRVVGVGQAETAFEDEHDSGS
jgi:hypothetical protein